MSAVAERGPVAFIGAGQMAEALVQGMLAAGVCTPKALRVADVSEARRARFAGRFGVQALADNAEAARGAAVIVLAVKPQVMDAVLGGLRGVPGPESLVLSIAAGITTARIEAALGDGARVARAMPNTPALVGAGVTALCGGRGVGPEDLNRAARLLEAVGPVVRVAEAAMDAVTALSGSGPAYVFYLVEALLRAAERLGLEDGDARQLVRATVEGSARLLEATGEAPADLRRRVTSPGGTTEAAIRVLDEHGVGAAVEAAVIAAHARARELAGGR